MMNMSLGYPYSLPTLIETICKVLADQKTFYLMRDGLGLEELPERTIILRFDVERDLEHHLKIAKRLADADTPCTMYFHTRKECYHPPILKKIQETGCEVGYHHECIDRCRGDLERARELFLREVEMFRRDGLDVRTACPHGEVGIRREGYRDNLDLFRRYPSLLKETGLVGDAVLKAWENQPVYASDTFSKYDQFWQKIAAGAASPWPLIIAAHLHRWRDYPTVSGVEVSHDLLRGLSNKAFGKRSYNVVT